MRKKQKQKDRSKRYGGMTAHGVGIIMKELVWRAIKLIGERRFCFESTEKVPLDPNKDKDFFTTADIAAQKSYEKSLRECFPNSGIIGEEDALKVKPAAAHYGTFTVDPLDGTKAFMRGQSHGIGSMTSLVIRDRVVSAWVGDVNTGELYGYRPESEKVHRLSPTKVSVHLKIDEMLPLSAQYVLLRKRENKYSNNAQKLIAENGLFREVEITGGSIGILMARLWKGEVGAVLLDSTPQTPWDICPVLGISKKLGFVFLEVQPKIKIHEFKNILSLQKCPELLVVHKSRLSEIVMSV